LPLRRLRRREREILGRIDRVSTKRPGSGERDPGATCLTARLAVDSGDRRRVMEREPALVLHAWRLREG